MATSVASLRKPVFLAGLLVCVAFALSAVHAQSRVKIPDPFATDPLPEGWYARVVTSLGEMTVFLHPDQAPQSVAHFVGLANAELEWIDRVSGEKQANHYYDGLTVHRIKALTRFEAGDPHGTGSGSPKLYVPAEVGRPMNFSQPFRMGLTRASLGRISGAQFFITSSAEPYLNARHPCIGTVVRGKDVVRAITESRTYPNGRPVESITLKEVRVFKSGDPAPIPAPVPYDPPQPKLSGKGLRQN